MKAARILVVLLALAGCTSGVDAAVDPVWGKQACSHCGMLVSEKPPSAQLTLKDGTRLFFDDVGCLVLELDRHGAEVAGTWVRQGELWTRAEAAHFAPASTPMDYGYVGAAQGIGWPELKAHVHRQRTEREASR